MLAATDDAVVGEVGAAEAEVDEPTLGNPPDGTTSPVNGAKSPTLVGSTALGAGVAAVDAAADGVGRPSLVAVACVSEWFEKKLRTNAIALMDSLV